MTIVRFVHDDRYGLWSAGDEAEDLGPESDHSDAPPIRLLRLRDGQVLSLTDPRERGLIEDAPPPGDGGAGGGPASLSAAGGGGRG